MDSETDPDLSTRQLATHILGGLPIGLLLGFFASVLAYVVLMYPVTHGGLSESLTEIARTLFRVNAVFVGVCVTGLWIWYAEDIETGIRLADPEPEDDDA